MRADDSKNSRMRPNNRSQTNGTKKSKVAQVASRRSQPASAKGNPKATQGAARASSRADSRNLATERQQDKAERAVSNRQPARRPQGGWRGASPAQPRTSDGSSPRQTTTARVTHYEVTRSSE